MIIWRKRGTKQTEIMTHWIQQIHMKKGALKKQLGVSEKGKIPPNELKRIAHAKIGSSVAGHKVTPKLKKRAVLAETLKSFNKKRGK